MKQNLSYTSMLKYDTNVAYILCKKNKVIKILQRQMIQVLMIHNDMLYDINIDDFELNDIRYKY